MDSVLAEEVMKDLGLLAVRAVVSLRHHAGEEWAGVSRVAVTLIILRSSYRRGSISTLTALSEVLYFVGSAGGQISEVLTRSATLQLTFSGGQTKQRRN